MDNKHKTLWRLSGPLIISNLSIALLGIVDTAVVGHLSHPYYLGAVAVAAVIFDFVYWSMGFLRMGTTGIVAQSFGKQDADGIRKSLFHAMVLAQVIALLILGLQGFILDTGLYLVGGSPEVKEFAGVYFRHAVYGAPAVLGSLALLGCLLGLQNARATLFYAVIVNSINIVLDLLLVFGLDMGVKGVAIASVISQYCGLILALFFIRAELGRFPGSWRSISLLEFQGIKRMISLNQNIFIRTVCLIFVFGFFARQGAAQGDVILAANAVLLNFQAITSLGLDGFANAAEALVGKAIGAGDRKSFGESIQTAFLWSIGVSACFALAYWLAGTHIISLMTGLVEVRQTALVYLPWLIASPLISVWCFVLDGIFIGAVKGEEMRDSMIFSTFLVFLPGWLLLQPLANHGLWLAMMLFFTGRGISLAWYFYRINVRQGGFVSPGRE